MAQPILVPIFVEQGMQTALQDLLQAVQLGLEEEGIPSACFQQQSMVPAHAPSMAHWLAKQAAEQSSLSVGVGLDQKQLVLHHQKLPLAAPVFCLAGHLTQARQIGTNAARLVKGLPFVFEQPTLLAQCEETSTMHPAIEMNAQSATALALLQRLFNQNAAHASVALRPILKALGDDWMSSPSPDKQQLMVGLINGLSQKPIQYSHDDAISESQQQFILIQDGLLALVEDASSSAALKAYAKQAMQLIGLLMRLNAVSLNANSKGGTADSDHSIESNTAVNRLDAAQALAASVIAQAQQRGVHVVVCVLDHAGHLILKHKMDDALLISIAVAEQKAHSAIWMKMPSSELAQQILPNQPLYGLQHAQPNLCALAGGLPLYVGGRLVGAIGVSGAALDVDEGMAKQAVADSGLTWHPDISKNH